MLVTGVCAGKSDHVSVLFGSYVIKDVIAMQ